MNVSFDKPDHGWIDLTMGEQRFVLSSAPCDAPGELVDALINAAAYGSGAAHIDAEGGTFRLEFARDGFAAHRSSHGQLLLDEQIPIEGLETGCSGQPASGGLHGQT